jgi:hypothetical protein
MRLAFCTFCQEDEETIEHLFWNCEIVQAFIDEIDSWLLSNGVSIPFTMHFFLSCYIQNEYLYKSLYLIKQ